MTPSLKKLNAKPKSEVQSNVSMGRILYSFEQTFEPDQSNSFVHQFLSKMKNKIEIGNFKIYTVKFRIRIEIHT